VSSRAHAADAVKTNQTAQTDRNRWRSIIGLRIILLVVRD
jgi:hypothetical protein